MSQEVNIKELNERIKKESEFVDLLNLEEFDQRRYGSVLFVFYEFLETGLSET